METLREIRQHVALAWPLAMANVLHTLSTVVIFAYLSRLGSAQVASAALAIATFTPFSVFITGFVSAKIPLFAALNADPRATRAQRRHLTFLVVKCGLAIAAAIMLLLSQAHWLYRASGQHAEIAAGASAYVMVLMWSLPLIMCNNVLRLVMAVYGRGRFVIASGLITLSANALLGGYAVAHGGGMNALAAANVFANLLGLAAMFLAARPLLATADAPRADGDTAADAAQPARAEGADWREIMRLGIPAAFNQCLQVGIFNLWFFLIGAFDPRTLAAFAISTQFTSLAFVAVSGSSQAISIQVAAAAAIADFRRLWRDVRAAFILVLGTLFVYCGAIWFLAVRYGDALFAEAASKKSIAVVDVSAILPFTISLLTFDIVQILFIGLLRGLKSTMLPLKISLVGNLAVGVPVAYALAVLAGLRVDGILLGAIIGSVVSMLLLLGSARSVARRRMTGLVAPGGV